MSAEERIIVARGVVNEDQQRRARLALQQLGFMAEVVEPEQHDQLSQYATTPDLTGHYTFSEITTREQYLGLEHLQQFHPLHASDLSPKLIMNTLKLLVKPRIVQGAGRGAVVPPESVGLQVDTREDAGLPELSAVFTNKSEVGDDILNSASQVGGALDFIDSLNDRAVRSRVYGVPSDGFSTQRQFLTLLYNQLTLQTNQS